MHNRKIKIDVVSDVVCPWCYIGKRRLEKAIESLSDEYEFDVEYHPFELNPKMPLAGLNQKAYLTEKFGDDKRYKSILEHVTQTAAEEGLTFDFSKQEISPNTRDAHRIIQKARSLGKQASVKEALMHAYFTEGVDLSKTENIVSIAVKSGLSKQLVEDLLNGEEGLAEVAFAQQQMQTLGITAVPFYIIENQFGLSGAQPSETFINAIKKAAETSSNP